MVGHVSGAGCGGCVSGAGCGGCVSGAGCGCTDAYAC